MIEIRLGSVSGVRRVSGVNGGDDNDVSDGGGFDGVTVME